MFTKDSKRKTFNNCEKVAVVSYKQLGDILLLQPTLTELARQTGTSVSLLTKPGFFPLLELMEGVIGAGEGPFDMLFCVHPGSRSVGMSFRTCAKRKFLIVTREQHLRWYHRLVFNDCFVSPQRNTYWALQHWRNLIGGYLENYHEPLLKHPPADWCPPGFRETDYFLIHPTAAWPQKFWNARGWWTVARHIKRRYGCNVVLTGGNSSFEANHLQEITRSEFQFLNFSGKTSLRQFIYLLANARSVVTIDGAASHLARAFNKPVVTLFGQTNPMKWSTEIRPWQRVVKSDTDKRGRSQLAARIPALRVTVELDLALTHFARMVDV